MPRKTPEQQEFFMRINNPNNFRRNLLEASKMTLNILKQIHGVRQVRETKHELISKISKEIKELKMLVHKVNELIPNHKKEDLKKILPKKSFKKKAAKKPVEQPAKTEKVVPEPKSKEPVSEIERITKALEEVQSKLQNL